MIYFVSVLFTAVLASLPYSAVLLPAHSFDLTRRDLGSSGFTSASWIWLSTPSSSHFTQNAPAGTASFLKLLPNPPNKSASSALITITADDSFTLWVNGQPVGASPAGQDTWKTAFQFSAALNASDNIIGVMGVNTFQPTNTRSNPAGLAAAVQVRYTDGSTEVFGTDSTWLGAGPNNTQSNSTYPVGFPLPSTDQARVLNNGIGWSNVSVAGLWDTVGPWGNASLLPPSAFGVQNLSGQASWIWNSGTAAAAGSVGFRKTLVAPDGKTPANATVLVTADNALQLFVDSAYVGASPSGDNGSVSTYTGLFAQRFVLPLTAQNTTFDIIAQNFSAQQNASAGVLAAILVQYTDGSSQVIGTDNTWLASGVLNSNDPSAFVASDAKSLSPASVLGPYGTAPWGQLTGTSDILNAAAVPANVPVAAGSPSSVSSSPTTTTAASTPAGLAPAQTSFLFVPSQSPNSGQQASGAAVGLLQVSVHPMLLIGVFVAILMTC
ncbi:unnamed protein product [Mycena citricolor]|uniref:Uncharacterized protein n=1 Tax=Mycena citricolor TaxID=2018698 RepID=A0AAD2H2T5_9AGAR|nr:unnamed protein product [Mycena citricolor]